MFGFFKSGGPKGGAPKHGGPKGGGPKIRVFFFPLPPHNSFISPSLVGPFVEFWCCAGTAQMCTFGVLRLSCEARAAAQTRTLKGPGASNTTKIPREDTQRGKKKNEFCGGKGNKERNFGRSRGRAVPGRAVPGAPNMTKPKP